MRAPATSILTLTLAGLTLAAASAHAQSLGACGDVYVPEQANCTVVPPSAECSVMCTPVTVEASCAAKLYADCSGRCTADIDAQCNVDCSARCSASCTVDPGKLDCSAECQGSCAADCDAHCSGSSDVHCKASCKASCSGSCNARCDVVPPSANCSAKCDAACKGSCHAKANVDCNVKCEADGYVKCQADVKGGCDAACKADEGALFCNGQFIDHDNLDQCVAALKSALDVNVQGYAEGDAACDAGTCKVGGEAGASCSASPLPASGGQGLLAGFGLLALGFVARRRRTR